MLSEDLRTQLEAIDRAAWLRPRDPAGGASRRCRYHVPHSSGAEFLLGRVARSPVFQDPAAPRSDFERLVPGQQLYGPAGSFYLIRQPLAECCSGSINRLIHEHSGVAAGMGDLRPELISFARSFPDRVLFLDLETCGFSGAPLFLIGLLRQADGELVIEQLLARDYVEEPAILAQLWSLVPAYDVMVTFNGKTFDWPFLLDRSTVHFRSFPPHPQLVHCDLLPLARRHWKKQLGLPNCRLQTLELALCRRYRSGDIPSYQVAPAYHAFIRSGDARLVRQILHHNAMDLLTLAQLSLTLIRQLTFRSTIDSPD